MNGTAVKANPFAPRTVSANSKFFDQGSGRDITPQQDSLSGVIICPAYWMGQRLRVNSVTTTNPLLHTNNWQTVKGLRRLPAILSGGNLPWMRQILWPESHSRVLRIYSKHP
jgi:hypothetical protein